MKKLIAMLIAGLFTTSSVFAMSHTAAAPAGQSAPMTKEEKADAKAAKDTAKADEKATKADAKAEKDKAKADEKAAKKKADAQADKTAASAEAKAEKAEAKADKTK
jgi:uncharacterized protein YxeA